MRYRDKKVVGVFVRFSCAASASYTRLLRGGYTKDVQNPMAFCKKDNVLI
jgi:hypothetical protein